ncbi:MAG TPA: hypothetical protein VLA74_13485 [Nitrososphaeraceae archaeon]|nr:hypothetical protein [Nitrososphaeraceae archaeon]
MVDKYGRHTVYTDMVVLGTHRHGGTWYPQTCNFLYLKHRLHSPLEKSLIDRKSNAILQRQHRIF